jgi:hypothetical protein
MCKSKGVTAANTPIDPYALKQKFVRIVRLYFEGAIQI